MRHKVLKSMVGCAGLCGLLAGCATTVDMGGPLGHYRYSYDSRATVYGDDTVYQGYTDDDRYTYADPGTGVTIYHHDDEDD